MHKSILLLVISCLTFLGIQAQNISGEIVEKKSGEALMGANISLLSVRDSSRVDGAISNAGGIFKFKDLKPGDYYLRISFIGFITYSSEAFHLSKNKDMGKILLSTSPILMDEVNIQSNVINKIDKKVYPIEEDILSETGTATQVLQNIPSVDVDINGGILLRNAGVAIFLNGKPSAILERNPAAFLQQLPAKMIEKIEVITNPSAKYKPNGVGGIINIVLKKENKNGLNGQVHGNVGFQKRYNGALNFNYGTENLNFFGNYGIRHGYTTSLITDERIFFQPDQVKNARYFENGRSSSYNLSQTIYTGTSWEPDDHNSLHLSGNYFVANSDHSGKAESLNYDSEGAINSAFRSNSTNDEHEAEGEAQFAMEHVFKNNEDHTLEMEATYTFFDEREDQQFVQKYSFPNNATSLDKNLVRKNGNEEEVSADYILPISEDTELEAGYAGNFSSQEIQYNRDRSKTRFLFKQNIQALYVQYSQPVSNFDIKVGLRGEKGFTEGEVKQPIDSLEKNNDFRLFPTLHLQYEMSKKSLLGLSYSRRIKRPDADMLNPNPEFTDPRNAEAGNANLKPEQVHSIELDYQMAKNSYSLTSSLYYRYRYDAFTEVQRSIGDTLIIRTVENLNSQQSAGIEANFSQQLTENWDAHLSGDVYFTHLDAGNLGYTKRDHGISGNLKVHSFSDLGDHLSLQLDGFYYFPSLNPQGRRKGFFYMNGGIKENILKDQVSITLTAIDIFHTYKVIRKTEGNAFYHNSTYRRLQPLVLLGVSWRFNQLKGSEEIEYVDEGL